MTISDIDPERLQRRDDDVDADIEFVPADEERVGDELLEEEGAHVGHTGLEEASVSKPWVEA